MKRREFIKMSAFAAFGTAVGCRTVSSGGSMSVNGIRIGVQMWSINDIWKKDPVHRQVFWAHSLHYTLVV